MKFGHIEFLEIKNYRMFRHVTLRDLQPMTVVIGANGTGKTTLLDIFTFLQDALLQNVSAAVAKRGGFGQLISRGEHGPIEITVKFRNDKRYLVTYKLQVVEREGHVIVAAELLKYRRGPHGKPWHFLDFKEGKGDAITNESAYVDDATEAKRQEYTLEDSSILAVKGLGQFDQFKVASMFRNLIEKWYISDFHIEDARILPDTGYAENLSKRGDNIAQVTHYLCDRHPNAFSQVLQAMRQRVPGVKQVTAHSTEDGRLVLRFQDGNFDEPFNARFVSDGTIKMFAYLTLIHSPNIHPILAIEEPENYLYPKLIPELVDEFQQYANEGGQVFITTHSPDFLNEVELKEIICLSKVDGFTVAERPVDKQLVKNLVANGEVPGRLWKQGLLFDHRLGG